MRILTKFAIAGSLMISSLSFANVVDDALVKQCVQEVDRGSNGDAVVTKYCGCMIEEQPEGDNTELLKWADTPAGKQADSKCDTVSGWQ